MEYDYTSKKIVAVVANGLEGWQAMNVIGHMAIALGANKDGGLMGKQVLVDASGGLHSGIARYGLVIKSGVPADIALLVQSAKKERGLMVFDFPREMLDTGHDEELVGVVSRKQASDFEYLGVLVYGESKLVNMLSKKFELWK